MKLITNCHIRSLLKLILISQVPDLNCSLNIDLVCTLCSMLPIQLEISLARLECHVYFLKHIRMLPVNQHEKLLECLRVLLRHDWETGKQPCLKSLTSWERLICNGEGLHNSGGFFEISTDMKPWMSFYQTIEFCERPEPFVMIFQHSKERTLFREKPSFGGWEASLSPTVFKSTKLIRIPRLT